MRVVRASRLPRAGSEPPARQSELDYAALADERYFLLCRTAATASAAIQVVVAALRDPGLRAVLDALPGYSGAGTVTPLRAALATVAEPG